MPNETRGAGCRFGARWACGEGLGTECSHGLICGSNFSTRLSLPDSIASANFGDSCSERPTDSKQPGSRLPNNPWSTFATNALPAVRLRPVVCFLFTGRSFERDQDNTQRNLTSNPNINGDDCVAIGPNWQFDLRFLVFLERIRGEFADDEPAAMKL